MPARRTRDSFIEDSKKRHGNKYSYSNVVYINNSTKVEISCSIHGSFLMKPMNHLTGQGCPSCGREQAKKSISLSWVAVEKRLRSRHGDKFTYFPSTYQSWTKQMKMVCPTHGPFHLKPHTHFYMDTGCSLCGKKKAANSNQIPYETVLDSLNQIHNHRYEYDRKTYKGIGEKIKIKCPKHGWFWQRVANHKNGEGCRKCSDEKSGLRTFLTFDKFITRAQKKHSGLYDYSRVHWVSQHQEVEIICPKHGAFHQVPRDHYRGAGCPICNYSRGEMAISNFLIERSISFEPQKTFSGLENKKPLKCDFYLTEFHAVIEYNGKQHYQPVEVFGGPLAFKRGQQNDELKKNFCLANGIKFYVIKFDDNIENELTGILQELTQESQSKQQQNKDFR